jgi:hypothetical protein
MRCVGYCQRRIARLARDSWSLPNKFFRRGVTLWRLRDYHCFGREVSSGNGWPSTIYERYRGRLTALTYHRLGSISEAEVSFRMLS